MDMGLNRTGRSKDGFFYYRYLHSQSPRSNVLEPNLFAWQRFCTMSEIIRQSKSQAMCVLRATGVFNKSDISVTAYFAALFQ